MTVSRLDQLYRRLLLTKFFTKGWGKPDNLKRLFAFRKILSNRDTCQHLVAPDYPINIDSETRDGDCIILEGHFTSPFIHHLPGIMPKEVETASFQMILPLQWQHSSLKPVCIHLAGTGDHYFWRRRIFTARPLLKEAGIASILLENPYYGTRKPKHQLRSSLHNVSDLFVMGGALVLESLALLHWCERQGWGPLGLSGVSMGGHMACGAATLWPKPVSLIPILSWTTASIIFTQGVMSGAIPWKTLQEQFFENSVYQDEIRKLIVSPEEKRKHKAYDLGQQFVKDYSHNIQQVESLHKQLSDDHTQASTSRRPGSALPGTQSDPAASQSSQQLTHLNNCDKNNPSSNFSLGASVSESQNSIDVKPTLTPEEYMARVSIQASFNEKQSVSILSPDSKSAETIVTTLPTAATISALNAVSKPPATSTLHHEPEAVSPPVSLKQHSYSSPLPIVDSSPSLNDKHAKEVPTSPTDSTHRTLRSTNSKEPQHVSEINSLVETGNLTLKNAISKSRLLVSHASPAPLPASDEQVKNLQLEALDFMRGVMDECTHLGNFSVPVDPELVIIVSAKQDAYVPKEGVIGLDQLWPGCEVRYVDQGHVGAVLFNQSVFRKAIADAFERQIKKYYQVPSSQADIEHSLKSAR
ncbi:hypothetical protein BsWGS_27553 [Bradybaena similaris]